MVRCTPHAAGSLIALFALALLPANIRATSIYQFFQDGTGETLAFLEFSSLPATENELVSLTFTPAGDAIFGLGEAYDGVFDSSAKTFVDDGNGHLVSSEPDWGANIMDSTPEEASTLVGSLREVIIGTSDPGEPVDVILLDADAFNTLVFATGSFIRVPETATIGLLAFAVAAAGVRRRAM